MSEERVEAAAPGSDEAAFDIVFGDATFWPGLRPEGYISMAGDANHYTVGFTNPEWATLWPSAMSPRGRRMAGSPNV